jgi:soluble lytic murein transglycosylase-like protein
MRFAYLASAALVLGVLASPVLAAPTRHAGKYLQVRDRAQLASSYTLDDIQTKPQKFNGLLLEVKGVITGIAESSARTTLLLDRGDGASALSVVLPPDMKVAEWPFLQAGTPVRVLCRVIMVEGSANGELELRIPVPEGDAASAENEREATAKKVAAAAKRRGQPSGQRLSSRGVSASTYQRAPGSAYSEAELLGLYSNAVLTFNRRLAPGTARHIAGTIIEYSRRYGLDARLVMAVIACESNFNANAVSRVGAMGLGQLMPGTASGLGVGNAWDPRQNLEGSTRLLRSHIANMSAAGRPPLDAIKLALACYNAGAGAVRKYKGIPPYKETQTYVKRITRIYWQMLTPDERTWDPD